ncbi:MAG: EamA family transporter [Rhodocyclaceae bacterium]|jgi:drug/metabolite transporter (DMT)-like permease|nr:EamA family transporter [Rhodocyclaceae bacterium]MCL4758427.1 EamA family transporter [Rhodocyclaceae bacterium]
MPPTVIPTGVYLKLVASTAFWGGAFIAGRHLAQHMPHFLAATGRFAVALIPLLIFARLTNNLPRLSGSQTIATLLLGATGVFAYNALFLAGLEHLPASRAALIVALSPIMTMMAMRVLARERWSRARLFGVVTSLVGAALVITRGDLAGALSGAVGLGELWILLAVIAWVAYTLIGRRAMQGLNATAATAWSTLWGTLMLALPAAFELAKGGIGWPSPLSWLAIVYLGVGATAVAFVWYNQAVAAIGPAAATLFTNLVPVFAVVFSMLLLGETLALASLLGGVMVVVGVFLANRAQAPTRNAP